MVLSIPMYIHIPYNWTSKNYILQYKISNETHWSTKGLNYSYHGTRGHTHGVGGNTGNTSPDVSGTSGSGTSNVSDSGHTH